MQKALFWKLVLVVVLCLLAAIPLAMVRGVIDERQALRDGVVSGFEAETVGRQAIKGPVIVVPYRKTVLETTQERIAAQAVPVEIKRKKVVEGRLYFMPDTEVIEGSATVEERKRGIYKAQAYSGTWRVTGHIDLPARFGIHQDYDDYSWGTPKLVFGIGDPRGIAPGYALTINGKKANLEPGSGFPSLERGVHAVLDAAAVQAGEARSFDFDLDMTLAGLNSIQFLPAGRTSTVKFNSGWPHPSFFGPLLAQHQIGADGFRATWKTSFLANNLTSTYADCFDANNCGTYNASAFGVSLIEPVDLYQQLERAIKYGLLFVGLTFSAFFLYDVLKQCPIHPVQYGLVGVALVVFYLLLTSLSEHIDFGIAYLVAASSCACLIGYYVAHVLGAWRRGALVGSMIGALYGALYVILRSEDNAMLMGSVLLFLLVAAVMVGTRNVDWYRLGRQGSAETAA